MSARFATVVAALALVAVTFFATPAHADPAGRSNSIHILEIDSDDADDQAEALTGALRSHLRASTGWALVETTQSLSMLTAALRCPRHPDSGCLTRIGDRLKADRFLWGLMNKAPGHQVSIELHFWVRGEPDAAATETYSDNLKDPSDDGLRKVAAKLLDQLIGTPPVTVNVDAGAAEGTVYVDGEERAQLEGGKASLQVPPGSHEIEVRGRDINDKQAIVVKGPSTDVKFVEGQQRHTKSAPEPEASKPFPWKSVVGWGAIGVGVVFGVVAGLEAKGWADANNVNKAYLKLVPQGTSVDQACSSGIAGNTEQYVNACPPNRSTLSARSTRDSALAYTFGGLGAAAIGAGAIVLFVSSRHGESDTPPPAVGWHILPSFSPTGGGVALSATF